ncbi:Hsp33 family molecular chaperone HslO [Spiroplasma endosymbiont of Polydrusus pterygomalis]|uniref:Hsp33 family molecular chaperone HslO n=1 Tax=Spiroplasma endosymbiont of Polydrusus pterygomalis TaxID=3139327 RepID=UPI003CCB3AF2
MDKVTKAISNVHNIKMTVVDATKSLNDIIKLHETNPLATIVLSRVVLATILIGSDMKNATYKMTSIVNGNGPIGTIMAEYTGHKVRGFCTNPQFDVGEIDRDHNVISQVVGTDGYLRVMKDLEMKENFSGQIKLISGEINLDFTYYLAQSEQIKSIIVCSIKMNEDNTIAKAVGFFAQLLSGHKDEDIDYLEEKIENLENISHKLIAEDNVINTFKLIDQDAKVLEADEVNFECSCSYEKALESAKLLGDEQLNEILASNGEVEIACDFCRKKYLIRASDLKSLLKE